MKTLRPQKRKKCLVTISTSKLHCLPHVRSPPPWGRRRHGIGQGLPHLVRIRELHDMQDLRIRRRVTSSRAFMDWRPRYWTSDNGLHWCRDQGTSTANDEHLGPESSDKSAFSTNIIPENYLLSVHGVRHWLRSVYYCIGWRHQSGCFRWTAM